MRVNVTGTAGAQRGCVARIYADAVDALLNELIQLGGAPAPHSCREKLRLKKCRWPADP